MSDVQVSSNCADVYRRFVERFTSFSKCKTAADSLLAFEISVFEPNEVSLCFVSTVSRQSELATAGLLTNTQVGAADMHQGRNGQCRNVLASLDPVYGVTIYRAR
ncbi:hypothetical protein BaRGS_00028025 [Batillaria attramentaria]|uniref:Uncharacterized protein n=1 Tax=Batillaria attramentaria TaxID=370345 RepID=A0ABD0K158_9CAEN